MDLFSFICLVSGCPGVLVGQKGGLLPGPPHRGQPHIQWRREVLHPTPTSQQLGPRHRHPQHGRHRHLHLYRADLPPAEHHGEGVGARYDPPHLLPLLLSLISVLAAPSLRLKTSSGQAGEASVFTVGSSLSLTCTYLNTSMLEAVSSTTLLPWQPGPPLKVKLPSGVLAWTRNNKTFSTQNRKRFVLLCGVICVTMCGGVLVVCGAGGSEKYIFNFFLSGFYIKPQLTNYLSVKSLRVAKLNLTINCVNCHQTELNRTRKRNKKSCHVAWKLSL